MKATVYQNFDFHRVKPGELVLTLSLREATVFLNHVGAATTSQTELVGLVRDYVVKMDRAVSK